MESDAFDLARQWAVTFGISASNITEKHLRSLLESRKVDEAHRLLASLPKDELMPTCNALLQHLESLDDLLFVAQFVLRSPNVKLSASRTTMLRDTELGCSILRCLPDDFCFRLRAIVGQTKRIIEYRLMTKHTEYLDAVKMHMPSTVWHTLIQAPAEFFQKEQDKSQKAAKQALPSRLWSTTCFLTTLKNHKICPRGSTRVKTRRARLPMTMGLVLKKMTKPIQLTA